MSESLVNPVNISQDTFAEITIDSFGLISIEEITNGQIIYWNESNSQFENIPNTTITNIATGTGLTGGPITTTGTISLSASIDDLLDVDTTGITNGQVLAWNTSNNQFEAADEFTGVTSLAIGTGLTGGPITTTGTISLDAEMNDFNDVITTSITNGQILTWNTANNQFEPTDQSLGVTSVATGTGLSGGPIISTGTISLNAELNDLNDVTTESIADEQILTWVTDHFEPITNNKVTSIAAGTGLSGGTITSTGTLTLNAALSDLTDVDTTGATNNQVLKWNTANNQFEPSDDLQGVTSISAGTGLSGGTITSTGTLSLNSDIDGLTDVITTSITNGQVLAWNSSNSRFEPSDDFDGVTSITAGTGLSGGTITSTGTLTLSAALSNFTDADTTGATNGQILAYNISNARFEAADDAATGDVIDQGNSVGSTMSIGTSSNHNMNLIVNNTTAMTFLGLHVSAPTQGQRVTLGSETVYSGAAFCIDKNTSNPAGIRLGFDITNLNTAEVYFRDHGAYSRLSFYNYQDPFPGAFDDNKLSFNSTTSGITTVYGDTFEVYTSGASNIRFLVDSSGATRPGVDNTYTLGTSSLRWSTVYAANATINTSDRTQKTNIETSDLGLQFINLLNPVKFKYKDITYEKTSISDDPFIDRETRKNTCTTTTITKTFSRYHYGFIAQEIKDVIEQLGKTTKDFAGYVEFDNTYGLRYDEFIAPIIKSIQELDEILINQYTRLQSIIISKE